MAESSIKDKESALNLGRCGVHGAFLELLYGHKYSYRLETGVSGNLCRFLKEVKPLVLYAVEHGIAKEQMRGEMELHLVLISATPSYFAFLS